MNFESLKIRKVGPPRLPDLAKADENENPPASPGGLGRISLFPYPHAGAGATTTHGTGGGRRKHAVRIEARTCQCQTFRPSGAVCISHSVLAMLFCIARRREHPFCGTDNSFGSLGTIYEQRARRLAMAQWDVFSCQAARGKFSGGIF